MNSNPQLINGLFELALLKNKLIIPTLILLINLSSFESFQPSQSAINFILTV